MERPSGAHRSAKPSGRDRILKRLLQLRHEDVRTDLYTRTGRDLFSRARLAPSEIFERSFIAFEIYTMNSDGSGVTRLTLSSGVDDEPAWSFDGSRILFTSHRDGN